MKLLTRVEYDLLLESTQPCYGPKDHVAASGAEHDIFAGLIEQGRVLIGLCCGEPSYNVTPAGREALRLWPLVQPVVEPLGRCG